MVINITSRYNYIYSLIGMDGHVTLNKGLLFNYVNTIVNVYKKVNVGIGNRLEAI